MDGQKRGVVKAPLLLSKVSHAVKSLPEFCGPQAAKKSEIVFSRGVYVGKNTLRGASVEDPDSFAVGVRGTERSETASFETAKPFQTN